MIRFEPLASSSAGCCYIVRCSNHAPLMIDCGVSFKRIQEAMEFTVTGLAGCLVSHCHGDHSFSASHLMKAGVNCYASKETWEQLSLSDRHRAKALVTDRPTHIKPWTVQAFDAVHDADGTLGFLIAAPDGASKLLYLTDSAYSKYRFEGLTHIAVECNYSREVMRRNTASGSIGRERMRRTVQSHMSLDHLIPMLLANDLSKVEEIHLLHLSDANSDEAEFKAAVQRATGKPVYIAPKEVRA